MEKSFNLNRERHTFVFDSFLLEMKVSIDVYHSGPARIVRARGFAGHSYELSRGDTLQIHLPFQALPAPTITIRKNGLILDTKANPDASTRIARQHVQLHIRNVTREDAGTYTFEIENTLGRDSESAEVVVFDRPSVRPTSVRASLRDRGCALLEWDFDEVMKSRERVTNFVVESARGDRDDRWVRLGTCKRHSFQASNLLEGERYRFRVSAENLYGKSEPSEPTQWLQAQKFVWCDDEIPSRSRLGKSKEI